MSWLIEMSINYLQTSQRESSYAAMLALQQAIHRCMMPFWLRVLRHFVLLGRYFIYLLNNYTTDFLTDIYFLYFRSIFQLFPYRVYRKIFDWFVNGAAPHCEIRRYFFCIHGRGRAMTPQNLPPKKLSSVAPYRNLDPSKRFSCGYSVVLCKTQSVLIGANILDWASHSSIIRKYKQP